MMKTIAYLQHKAEHLRTLAAALHQQDDPVADALRMLAAEFDAVANLLKGTRDVESLPDLAAEKIDTLH